MTNGGRWCTTIAPFLALPPPLVNLYLSLYYRALPLRQVGIFWRISWGYVMVKGGRWCSIMRPNPAPVSPCLIRFVLRSLTIRSGRNMYAHVVEVWRITGRSVVQSNGAPPPSQFVIKFVIRSGTCRSGRDILTQLSGRM